MPFFGITLIVIVTLLHSYVFAQLAALPLCRRRGRWPLLAVGALLWLLFVLGLESRFRGQLGLLAAALELGGMQWLGMVFLLAVSFFAADLLCGFGLLFSRTTGRTVSLACGAALVLIAHVQGLRPPVIERQEAVLSNLPAALDGTTIVMLTDLHLGEPGRGAAWLRERVQQTQALQPDCVVLVGDLFERGSKPEELIPVLRQFSAPLGVFAVRGNHDALRPGRPDLAGEILAAADIRLLRNEWAVLAAGLVLSGIDDLTASSRRPGEGEANLAQAVADRPVGAAILLSHTPWLIEQAAAAKIGLMLSGHTHNGQIWPFGCLARTRYPYLTGRHAVDGMTLIVSRGTGSWGPRMRLWQRAEISLITLRGAAETP